VISVNDLRYSYPGAAVEAVAGVSFTVERGEIFGLLGPSGAGKSTIQGVLTRRNRRFQGSVSALGRNLRDWDWRYYERIGVGFEAPNHYLKMTARENLAFFGALHRGAGADPSALLDMVGLAADADKRVGHFSRGMMVRLSFIRAIAHDPEILFLDEPTAGLDPVNAAQLKEIIRERNNGGTTIVLTTHNMHDVDELCDRVAFIVAGRLVTIDRPVDLKLKHGRRAVRVEFTAEGADHEQEFPLDGLGENEAFQDILRRTHVRAMHSQEASLEEVFAKVTGVTLDGSG
jgi:fluoroquinolone transport system ATP-binding protein